jgi:hypothetical protein
VLLFDGDRIRGQDGRAGSGTLWAGACFGFAAAIKIWAVVPALVAWVLCLLARRGRLRFAGGFAAGIAVPCLPFLVLAPSGFGRTVFLSELVQATHGRVGANPRVADVTGIVGLSSVGVDPHIWAGIAAAAALVLLVAAAWLRDRRAGSPLDWFALVATVAVTGMLFSPSEWYEHYAAFAAPFLVVLVALSASRLFAPGRAGRDRRWVRAAAAVIAVLAVAAMGAGDGYAVTKLYPARDLSAASALIPAGACVLTDTASAAIVINRFSSSAPGCPALVDAVGTLIATTDGRDFVAGPAVLAADARAWQLAFQQAGYVWLIGNSGYTGARIAWTPALHAYFTSHFRLIGLPSSFPGIGNVPPGGLYVRTSPRPGR